MKTKTLILFVLAILGTALMTVANTTVVLNKGSATMVTLQKANTAGDVSLLVMSNNNESACYPLEDAAPSLQSKDETTFAVSTSTVMNPLPGETYAPWRNNFSNNAVAIQSRGPSFFTHTSNIPSAQFCASLNLTGDPGYPKEPSLVLKRC